MTATSAFPAAALLDAELLRDVAAVLSETSTAEAQLLGPDLYLNAAAFQLVKLAELNEAYLAEQAALQAAADAAAAAELARKEAEVQSVVDVLKRVGTRRTQAINLLAAFDITPKAA